MAYSTRSPPMHVTEKALLAWGLLMAQYLVPTLSGTGTRTMHMLPVDHHALTPPPSSAIMHAKGFVHAPNILKIIADMLPTPPEPLDHAYVSHLPVLTLQPSKLNASTDAA